MADSRTVTAGVTLVIIVVWAVVSGARVYTRRDEPARVRLGDSEPNPVRRSE